MLMAVGGCSLVLSDGASALETSDEVRALVSEMLNDAQTRSSLLQGGGSAGHDGHFFMASADGNFRMNVSGQVQFRWVLNSADESVSAPYNAAPGQGAQDDLQHGFENRRTKMTLSGDAFGDEHAMAFYKITTSFSPSFGTGLLSDAFMGVDMGKGGRLAAGQMKVALHREWLVSSKYTQAVDRSLTSAFFGAGRSQGIRYENSNNHNLHYTLMLTDGANQINTSFADTQNLAFMVGDSDIALTGRIEMLVDGNWDVFDDMTGSVGQDRALLVGFAAHHQSADKAQDGDLTSITVDVSVEGDGWNVFGALMVQTVDTSTLTESDDIGLVVQGGYYFSDDTEGFVRYDLLAIDGNRTPTATGGNDELSTITVGVNRYIRGHALKLTIDVNLALDEGISHMDNGIGGNLIYSARGLGYLGDDDESELYVRTRLQLLF
jgi:hypothetical protein